jgi:UDP-3-O-[3-hydroxymyristoyl] glucosamine N-acyltransferase
MRLAELAERLGCELHGDGEVEIVGVAPIESANPGDLAFVGNPRYARYLKTTRAAAVILPSSAPPLGVPTLRTAEPHLAFARAIEIFHRPVRQAPGIHPTAVIADSAVIGPDASVGPYAVVGDGTRIGTRATLGPHVVIYPEVTIGDRFVAHAHVTVRERVLIGNDVILHAGVVIGSDGFGYVPTRAGTIHKVPQAGNVVLEDGVEIGANTTVDRAAVGSTILRRNVKLDNLVMVAHGCEVGPSCLLAAQVGLAGGTRLGRGVMLGGQVGSAGHLTIGDGAMVAAKSGVAGDLEAGGVYGGIPAQPIGRWRRASMAAARVSELLRRLRRLERAVGVDASDDEG